MLRQCVPHCSKYRLPLTYVYMTGITFTVAFHMPSSLHRSSLCFCIFSSLFLQYIYRLEQKCQSADVCSLRVGLHTMRNVLHGRLVPVTVSWSRDMTTWWHGFVSTGCGTHSYHLFAATFTVQTYNATIRRPSSNCWHVCSFQYLWCTTLPVSASSREAITSFSASPELSLPLKTTEMCHFLWWHQHPDFECTTHALSYFTTCILLLLSLTSYLASSPYDKSVHTFSSFALQTIT